MPRKRKSPPSDKKVTKRKIKHLVTHDFVLDVFQRAQSEKDPEAKAAIIATAEVLSRSIGQYLVDIKE